MAEDLQELDMSEVAGAGLSQTRFQRLQHPGELERAQRLFEGGLDDHAETPSPCPSSPPPWRSEPVVAGCVAVFVVALIAAGWFGLGTVLVAGNGAVPVALLCLETEDPLLSQGFEVDTGT